MLLFLLIFLLIGAQEKLQYGLKGSFYLTKRILRFVGLLSTRNEKVGDSAKGQLTAHLHNNKICKFFI